MWSKLRKCVDKYGKCEKDNGIHSTVHKSLNPDKNEKKNEKNLYLHILRWMGFLVIQSQLSTMNISIGQN